jgi:Tfp pilus assembly protein PilN
MPRINLVPREKQERTRTRVLAAAPRLALPSWVSTSPTFLTGVAALVVLLGCVFFYFGERRALAQTEVAIEEAEADSSRLHDSVLRVRALEEAQTRLAGRVQIMEQVIDGRLFWIELMELLSAALPEHTWLEKIDQEELAPDQIRIAGGTFTNAAVTDYMRGLEASPQLTDVTLVGVSRVEKDQVDYQSFTLIASFEDYQAVIIAPPDTTTAQE